MKFMAICGSGLGSSFMVEMNIQQVLKELGVTSVEVSHSDISSASDNDADVFFLARDVAENVSLDQSKIVILNSIIDKEELREKVTKVVEENNLI
jgi:B component PTS sysytem mannitol-specific enzyme II